MHFLLNLVSFSFFLRKFFLATVASGSVFIKLCGKVYDFKNQDLDFFSCCRHRSGSLGTMAHRGFLKKRQINNKKKIYVICLHCATLKLNCSFKPCKY